MDKHRWNMHNLLRRVRCQEGADTFSPVAMRYTYFVKWQIHPFICRVTNYIDVSETSRIIKVLKRKQPQRGQPCCCRDKFKRNVHVYVFVGSPRTPTKPPIVTGHNTETCLYFHGIARSTPDGSTVVLLSCERGEFTCPYGSGMDTSFSKQTS